jgi:hypothetical protein
MNKIKVIKRSGSEQPPAAPKRTESELRRQANEVRRSAADAVTGWIAEWRELLRPAQAA